MLPLRKTHHKSIHRLKGKGWKIIFNAHEIQKQAGLDPHIPKKKNWLQTKISEKKHYIIVKGNLKGRYNAFKYLCSEQWWR